MEYDFDGHLIIYPRRQHPFSKQGLNVKFMSIYDHVSDRKVVRQATNLGLTP
jgi:hypothetical protein